LCKAEPFTLCENEGQKPSVDGEVFNCSIFVFLSVMITIRAKGPIIINAGVNLTKDNNGLENQ